MGFLDKLTAIRDKFKNCIHNHFTTFKSNFWKYVSIRDVIVVSIALFVSHFSYLILIWLYPQTGEPSFQWLYRTIFGLTRGSIIMAYAFLIIRLLFPDVFFYLRRSFDKDITTINPWQKITLHLFVYCFVTVVFLWSVSTMT